MRGQRKNINNLMYGRETIDFPRAQVWLLGSKTTECLKHFGKFNRNLGGIFRGPL